MGVAFFLALGSCGNRFLELKPDQNQKIPGMIADYQALLDMTTTNLNPMNALSNHTLGLIGADDILLSNEQWQSFPNGTDFNYQKNAYLWQDVVYEGGEGADLVFNPIDYNTGYNRILTCNIVIDGLGKLGVTDKEEESSWNVAMGNALFHRAWNYYTLSQLYAPVYDAATANLKSGLPLNRTGDPTEEIRQATLFDTYQFILDDLHLSEILLDDLPLNTYRASRLAVYALLVRLYLQMGQYEDVINYAEKALQIKSGLLDYNTLANENTGYSFPHYGDGNPEVIFLTTAYIRGVYQNNLLYNPNPELMALYSQTDLRKDLFYGLNNGRYQFIGSYNGDDWLFTGLAVDELYLNLAEGYFRVGKVTDAIEILSSFCARRYEHWSDDELREIEGLELLHRILLERRKQLVMRGLRWEDCRRLNKDSNTATNFERYVDGILYTLRADDPVKWVWPFPKEATDLGDFSNR